MKIRRSQVLGVLALLALLALASAQSRAASPKGLVLERYMCWSTRDGRTADYRGVLALLPRGRYRYSFNAARGVQYGRFRTGARSSAGRLRFTSGPLRGVSGPFRAEPTMREDRHLLDLARPSGGASPEIWFCKCIAHEIIDIE